MISILVLEDDRELRETLEAVLSVEGYRVVTAATGEEAVRAAMESEFDLVVTDIRMPGIDGLQALEEMRKHCGDVESLVVTGYSTEEDSIRAIRLGAGDYLTKPFKLEDFLASVETILARRREANRRKEEERSLRHSLLWAAQLLADRRLRAAQATARRVAGALQLSAAVSESIQLAVLLSGLPRETEGFGPTLPPQVEHILANLDERWDGSGGPQGLAGADIPLEARVAAVALGNEGLDPSLVALREAPDVLSAESLPGSQARGLISLGRALEESAGGAAREAFERVALDAGRSREKLDALHGLARLAADPLEAREWLQKALELADSLGPLTSAASHLQAGLQLHRREPEGARNLLRRALDLYRRLGHPLGEARAVLALAAAGAAVDGTELACVTLAEDTSDLAEWLVPWLLTQEGEGSVQLLRRLLRGAPRGVLRLLQQGHLEASLRLRLVARLQETGGSGSAALLRVLAKDDDPRVRAQAAAGLGGEVVPTAAPLLRIYCLGPLEAYWGEERVAESEWKSRKTKQLFAMLASQRGRPVPEDRLVDVFWPDDLERGKKNLNWTLSALRKALRQGEVVVRNVGGVALNPDLPRWHDLEQLEDLIALGASELRAGQLTRPERFHGLLELYRGPYLEECYLDWASDIRNRLEAQLVPLLEGCVRLFQAAGQHHEALEFLGCLATVDPLHQEACLWSMQGYLALKRPELAIKHFKTFRDRLKRELQAEPSIELLEWYQRALLET